MNLLRITAAAALSILPDFFFALLVEFFALSISVASSVEKLSSSR